MPNRKLLIGGAIAILLSLAAYLITMPQEDEAVPVSREEFAQELKGLHLPDLKGTEREEALQHLQQSLQHMPVETTAEEARQMWGDPDIMKAMLSLQPGEMRRMVGPSSERFRRARLKRVERFFTLSEEEQNAEIDRVLDMIDRFEVMYKLAGGKHKDLMTEHIKRARPEETRAMVVEVLRNTDSADRARMQEGARRFFTRWAQRKQARSQAEPAAKARKAKAEWGKARKAETRQPGPKEILVARPVAEELGKLQVGDPVTITNLAEPGRPPRMIVARRGRQIGELPTSQWMTYAEYSAEKRQIWAKVKAVDAAGGHLLIEVTVK